MSIACRLPRLAMLVVLAWAAQIGVARAQPAPRAPVPRPDGIKTIRDSAAGPHGTRVISPDMQPVIAEMLPVGVPGLLPEGAVIESVSIRQDRIVVRLGLPDAAAREVSLVARDRPGSPDDPVRFALLEADGSPASGPVGAALAALVRQREGGFRWTEARRRETLLTAAETTWAPRLRAIEAHLAQAAPAAARRELVALQAELSTKDTPVFAAWDLALVCLRLGAPADARPYLERVVAATGAALADGGLLPELWQRRAGALRGLGQEAAAQQALSQCGQEHRATGACSVREMARLADAQGDLAAAAVLLDRELGDGRAAPLDALIGRAALAMRAGDAAGELRFATLAAARFPTSPEALELRAGARFRSRQFEGAVRDYEALYRMDPQRPSTLAHLSGAFNRLGGVVDASPENAAAYRRLKVEMHDRAARGNDVVAGFLAAVGTFYEARFEKAIEAFEKLEPALPREPRVSIYLAMSNLWLGREAQAQRHARAAVAKGPLDPDVWYCRSQAFRRQDPRQAADDLERYIALSEAPGAIQFRDKTERVRKELEMLRQGKMPPEWDRPGFGEAGASGLPTIAWLAFGLVGLTIWAVLWKRRRDASAR